MNRRRPRRQIEDIGEDLPKRTFFAVLAEDYDGIGQFTAITLSTGSSSAAAMARVAAGDFATSQVIPQGTKVSVMSYHGHLEILSLGVK